MSIHESGEMYLETIHILLEKNGSVRSVEIPNANRKSCREIAEILITRGSLQEKEKKLLRENAALVDELR